MANISINNSSWTSDTPTVDTVYKPTTEGGKFLWGSKSEPSSVDEAIRVPANTSAILPGGITYYFRSDGIDSLELSKQEVA